MAPVRVSIFTHTHYQETLSVRLFGIKSIRSITIFIAWGKSRFRQTDITRVWYGHKSLQC